MLCFTLGKSSKNEQKREKFMTDRPTFVIGVAFLLRKWCNFKQAMWLRAYA